MYYVLCISLISRVIGETAVIKYLGAECSLLEEFHSGPVGLVPGVLSVCAFVCLRLLNTITVMTSPTPDSVREQALQSPG